MADDFAVQRTPEGVILNREGVENLDMSFIPGRCAADPEDPETPRDRGYYQDTVLKRLIASGDVKDGTSGGFDDRKLRFDTLRIRGGTLEVALGITYYQKNRKDKTRDPAENSRLQQHGRARFYDAYAFFQRAIGVSSLLLTREGSLFLGERVNVSTDLGSLNGAAGYVEYTDRLDGINLEDEARREIKEECGVNGRDITKMNFVGVFSNPGTGETDFCYIVALKLSDEELLSAWDQSQDTEHGRRIKIRSYREAQQILEQGTLPSYDGKFKLMYPARGTLQGIKPEELGS